METKYRFMTLGDGGKMEQAFTFSVDDRGHVELIDAGTTDERRAKSRLGMIKDKVERFGIKTGLAMVENQAVRVVPYTPEHVHDIDNEHTGTNPG